MMIDEFEYGKKYNVEYEDNDGNIVKKHELEYIGRVDNSHIPFYYEIDHLKFYDGNHSFYININPYKLRNVELANDTEPEQKKIQLLVNNEDGPYRWKPNFLEIIGVDDFYPFCMLRIDGISYPAIYVRYDAESGERVFEYVHDGFLHMYGVTKDKIWNGECYIINFKSGKEVHRTSLIELGKQWNFDALKIGKPYRLVKDGKTTFALLSQITETCLVFVTAERDASNSYTFATDPKYPDNCYVEILVRPELESTDYDVYLAWSDENEKTG